MIQTNNILDWSDIQSIYSNLNQARQKFGFANIGIPDNTNLLVTLAQLTELKNQVESLSSHSLIGSTANTGITMPAIGQLIKPIEYTRINSTIENIKNTCINFAADYSPHFSENSPDNTDFSDNSPHFSENSPDHRANFSENSPDNTDFSDNSPYFSENSPHFSENSPDNTNFSEDSPDHSDFSDRSPYFGHCNDVANDFSSNFGHFASKFSNFGSNHTSRYGGGG